jgi:hypothetical protein
MSIPSISGTGRVSSVSADTTAPGAAATVAAFAAAGKNPSAPESDPDAGFRTPKPLRFPWLSRLSQQLEQSAPQKAAFAPAPMLGDNLDRTA